MVVTVPNVYTFPAGSAILQPEVVARTGATLRTAIHSAFSCALLVVSAPGGSYWMATIRRGQPVAAWAGAVPTTAAVTVAVARAMNAVKRRRMRAPLRTGDVLRPYPRLFPRREPRESPRSGRTAGNPAATAGGEGRTARTARPAGSGERLQPTDERADAPAGGALGQLVVRAVRP